MTLSHPSGHGSTAAPRSSAPMDARAIIAIDLGAESCRVSLLRWIDGSPHIELIHRHSHAPVSKDGQIRWNLTQIIEEVDRGLRRCAAIATEGIRSIAADGWAVDYVRLNDSGTHIADPFCYRDERTISSQQEVLKRISPERLQLITGAEIIRINTIYQLFADEESVQQKPWLNLPEYVLFRLGGRQVAEFTNATHTQLIDVHTRNWSADVLAAAGVSRDSVAPVVPPGTIVGTLSADWLDMESLRGVQLIAPACHDTASAIAGIPDDGDDWAYISSGTWSLVGTVLSAPLVTPAARAANFTNLGAVGGRICFHKNVNGMWLLRQCMAEWAQGRIWDIAELIQAAEQHTNPDAALLDLTDQDLMLPGDMLRRINGQLQKRGFTPYPVAVEAAPRVASLIFRSLAARYGEIVRTLTEITGKRFRRIYIVGGGSRNNLLNRLTAEATGLEVVCGAVESATIGNFAVQLATLERGSGTYGADASEVARWATRLLAT